MVGRHFHRSRLQPGDRGRQDRLLEVTRPVSVLLDRLRLPG